jgi:hypothetical protein
VQDRPFPQRTVRFVTCHNCGEIGHYRSDCPNINKNRLVTPTKGISTSGTKPAEVNLLEYSNSRIKEIELEVMVAKRAAPMQDIEPPMKEHHKRSKSRRDEGPSTREHVKKTRRKIGNEDLLISRTQQNYSIITDLGQQTANITIGQLIARCPSIRREFRQGINTRSPPVPTEVRITDIAKGELKSSQVDAFINEQRISSCMVDRGAAINVLSSWVVDEFNLKVNKSSCLKLKVADQRCIKSMGTISRLPISVNGVKVEIDFHVLDIAESRGGYPLILGRPWLKVVRAVNYWEKGNMKIGPHQHRINIHVIPDAVDCSKANSSPEESTDEEFDS